MLMSNVMNHLERKKADAIGYILAEAQGTYSKYELKYFQYIIKIYIRRVSMSVTRMLPMKTG